MKPKDRDFIQTVNNHLFCVVGYLHPPNGYTAYLKYMPSADGKWGKDGQRYRRTLPFYHVSQVENTYAYLRENYPSYLYDCPVRNITVSWVQKIHVKQYYKPRDKLREICSRGANDVLEQKLLDLATILGDTSLGVTGSILTGTHNPSFSDIDLTVYGYDSSVRLIEALKNLKEMAKQVKPISSTEKEKWVRSRAEKFPLSVDDLRRIAEKRWNYGYIEGTYFSIHPTKTNDEIAETFLDNTYHRKKIVKGTATVSENWESIYLPAVYGVEDVDRDENISEVVSYEGLYGSLFEIGEKIEFRGVLEEIRGKKPRHRVLIGGANAPNCYIKWV